MHLKCFSLYLKPIALLYKKIILTVITMAFSLDFLTCKVLQRWTVTAIQTHVVRTKLTQNQIYRTKAIHLNFKQIEECHCVVCSAENKIKYRHRSQTHYTLDVYSTLKTEYWYSSNGNSHPRNTNILF